MTKISSEEVRQKAVHAITRLDYSERQVAEIFGVSTRTIRRWVTQYKEEGQLAPKPHGHKKALFSADDVARVRELLLEQPDMTLEELRQYSDRIEEDVYDILPVIKCVERRNSYGGTSPQSTDVQISKAIEQIMQRDEVVRQESQLIQNCWKALLD